jgi:sugar (pentulose or hexulose) kinase
MKYILCIDIGTTLAKVLIFDLKGHLLKSVDRSGTIESSGPNRYEMDLSIFYRRLCDAIRELLSGFDASKIAAVGISAYMAGTIFIDKDLKEIGKSVVWIDARATQYFKDWEENGTASHLYELSGTSMLAGHTLGLLYWWRHNDPATLDRVRYLLFPKDWVRFKLTGQIHTDPSDATCTPADTFHRGFSREIMDLFEIGDYMYIFPPIVSSEKIIGTITKSAAEDTGLKKGTPVICGLGDMLAGLLGSGAIKEGQAVSIIGSTLLNGIIQDMPNSEPKGIGMTLATVDDKWARLINNTGGGTINTQWVFSQLYSEEQEKYAKQKFYDWTEMQAQKVPPTSRGIIYHPYINSAGVTAPFQSINARAQFMGIGLHHTRADMLRAVFEGIGLSIRDCYSVIPGKLSELRLTGGGSRSGVISQIITDCMDIPISIPQEVQSTALGTAILASVSIGEYKTIHEAVEQMVKIKKIYYPDGRNHAIYEKWYSLYKEIRILLVPIWEKRCKILNEIEANYLHK